MLNICRVINIYQILHFSLQISQKTVIYLGSKISETCSGNVTFDLIDDYTEYLKKKFQQ